MTSTPRLESSTDPSAAASVKVAGKRDWNRGEQNGQQQRQNEPEGHPGVVGVADHDHDHRRVGDEEVFYHAHNLVLLPVG